MEECRKKFKKGVENNVEREKVKGRTKEEGKQEGENKRAEETHKLRNGENEEEESKIDEKKRIVTRIEGVMGERKIHHRGERLF